MSYIFLCSLASALVAFITIFAATIKRMDARGQNTDGADGLIPIFAGLLAGVSAGACAYLWSLLTSPSIGVAMICIIANFPGIILSKKLVGGILKAILVVFDRLTDWGA